MKNTEHIRDFISSRIEKYGSAAAYGRTIGISGPSIGEVRRNITKELSGRMISAICREASITEEQLLAISKSGSLIAHESTDPYGSTMDKPARLAAFMRTLPEEKSAILYATAEAMGFDRSASSAPPDEQSHVA